MHTKFNTNSYWLKSGSVTFLMGIITVLLGFGSFFILVRVLLKAEFGMWVLFLTTTSIVEVVRQSLIQNGFVK